MTNAIIRLRRDNEINYLKIKDRFIPADGEICLVDTIANGLRVVCGDGKTTFGELQYLDDFIIKGYFFENNFYEDIEHTIKYPAQVNKIYICKASGYSLYIYDDKNYHKISGEGISSLPTANAQTAGVLKLYSTIGFNEDGTMTQKAITEELNEKVEIELNKDEELLIFTY